MLRAANNALPSVCMALLVSVVVVLCLQAHAASTGPVNPSIEIASYTQSPTVRIYQLLLREVYAFNKLEAVFHTMPVPRAIREVENGSFDALLMTSKVIDSWREDLVQVPEPLPTMNFKLMALKSFTPKTLDPTFKEYSVGYIHGIRFLEEKLRDAKSIAAQNGYEQLLQLLHQKRVELIIIGEWDAASLSNDI